MGTRILREAAREMATLWRSTSNLSAAVTWGRRVMFARWADAGADGAGVGAGAIAGWRCVAGR